MLNKLIRDVDRRRRLGQGHNAVEEELGIPSLQQSAERFEGAAHSSADVEPGSDGLVPGNLGDDSDSRIGEAAKILHGDRLEPNPIGSAGVPNLPDLPSMGQACSIAGLLRPPGDDVVSKGCGDADVQCQVLGSGSEGDEQVRWSSVQAWEEETFLSSFLSSPSFIYISI